jgi:drug/metabolite transporter (DMT)-like permease
MFMGTLFAICACFIWGTIFVIPQFLHEFSSLEIALGRYLAYGLISCVLFFRKGLFQLKNYPKNTWKTAFLFAIFSNLFYYPPLIIGIRYATAPVTVLIVGLCPLLVALYGNFKAKECSFRSLIIPAIWILAGILLVNGAEVDWSFSSSSPFEYFLGIIGALSALFAWTFFAVQNAQFLKTNPHFSRSEWSTLIGLTTLICTFILVLTLGFIKNSGIDLHKFIDFPSSTLSKYFLGIAFLGLVCSWVGSFLWNEASSHLPLSVMGPLIIFETIFGLLFVFIVEKKIPSALEIGGVCAMLWGIASILYLFRKSSLPSEINKADS